MSLSIALAQFTATTDVDKNTDTCIAFVEQAAALGARLIVLPEYSLYADFHREFPDKIYAQELDGPFVSQLRELAHRHGIYIIVGITETTTAADAKAYNTLVFINDTGQIHATYRKIHLYDAFGFRKSDTYVAGPVQTPPTLTIDDVTLGAITCYDLRFPELSRLLAFENIHALVVPAAWAAGPAKEMHWESLLRARAIENTLYVLGVGQTGPKCTGNTQAIDPMGFTVAHAGEAPSLILTSVDPKRVEQVRESNPSLRNRRFHVTA